MTTYTLTVSTDALGLGVISGARVSMEKRRAIIANAYPPTDNLYRIELPTSINGICSFLLEPDDSSTFHTAKVFDTNGIPVFQKQFSMSPQNSNLEDYAIGVVIGASLIQFKDEGVNQGTPTTVKNVNIVGGGVTSSFVGDTLTIDVQGGAKGFVAITDITATNPSDNVGSKVKTDDNNVLQSCVSSSTSVTVSVLAVTGTSAFKPSVTVNGILATLTRNATTDVWSGTAAITLTGTSPYTVTATHSDGAVDTAAVTIEDAPVITLLEFSNAYSQGAGQTEHAAGQKLDLTITSPTLFDAVEIIYTNGLTATTAIGITEIDDTLTHTLEVTIADQGSYGTGAPLILPAKARIRNLNGTWSSVFSSNDFGGTNGTHILALNNTRPVVTAGVITYPASQFALKLTEQATVAATYANVDSVLWTSASQLTVSSPTVMGNVTVNRLAGGYNVSTTNLTATAQRVANATSSTTNVVVWIADTPPVITKVLPAARLRSGISAQPHVIRLDSDQRLISIDMAAGTITGNAAGTFSGVWATANNGLTNTRTLSVADIDPKGTATFTSLSAINLAGREVTTVTTDLDYVLGGFVIRTVTVPSYHPSGNRQVAIGTAVTNTALLRASNLSKGGGSGSLNTTYLNSLVDTVDRFTITDSFGSLSSTGDTLYNLDLVNAQTNISGSSQFEIEELVS